MNVRRTKLVEARARKGWSLETAAERIGCAPNTLSRWELGVMAPSAYHRARICQAYGLSEEELGLTQEGLMCVVSRSKEIQTLINADLSTYLQDLALAPHSNCQEAQRTIARSVEEFTTMNTGQEAALTRREALQRLVMFPIMLMSRGIQRSIEDTLNVYAAGITACGYLSAGNHEDLSVASSMLSAYLPVLKTIVQESALHRKEAASLVAQCYRLKHTLTLHLESPNIAIARGYAKHAVTYSEVSGDTIARITALRNLAWAYNYIKQYPQALKAIEQAEALIQQKRTSLPPYVSSTVYSVLAVMQTKNGISPDSSLGLAQDCFFASSLDRSSLALHTGFNYAQLMRNHGLAQYYRGEYQEALAAFAKVIDPETLASKELMAVRTRVELLNNQTMAVLKSPARDMEQAITYWKASIQEAITLRTQNHFDDACTAYEVMQGIWPNEPRIKELRDLIVHW